MKKFLIILVILIIIGVAVWMLKIIFISQSGSGDIKTFVIESGEGVNAISRNLKNEGLLDNSLVFESLLWLQNKEGKLQAGEYQLQDTQSISDLITAFVNGEAVINETEIKILEGWNLRDIGDYFENKGIAKADEFYDLVGYPGVDYNVETDLEKPRNYSVDYEFLKERPANLSYEGYLFPDTYRVYKNSTVEDIVLRMFNNFDKKITSKMLGDIHNQGKKLYEILTLASIIEKEADTPENKKKVAGVYYNRLKIGMALQADPTVNYITGKMTDRPSYEDIETDSLYNTYLYPGLPPGPICNPGLDSIMAAIYPDNNNYLYFINTPDGEMIFAENFEQHKANRAKYFTN